MKTKIIAALLLCAIALRADAHARKTKKHPRTAAANTSMIKLQRTACFGHCPEYDLTVYASGLVEYYGKRNAGYTGVYQKNIDKAQAAGLIKKFADQRIDTCKDFYEKRIPDLPGLWYEYTINGKKGKVVNADSGPIWLRVMSSEVDALGHVDDTWKKVRE